MKYLNIKSQYGVETVDSLDEKDFSTFKEFRVELRRLHSEYQLAGMNTYTSQRKAK
tara:strand:+ start:1878 stop:2045 length:168 start_codon:yes stop_codon:yes gene_type:complete